MSNNPNQTPPPPGPGGYGSSGSMPGMQPEYPQGTTILVLGIVSLVCCSLAGPVAWYMGSQARKDIAASPTGYSNSNLVTIGWVMGIISTVLMIALIVIYGAIFIAAAAGSS